MSSFYRSNRIEDQSLSYQVQNNSRNEFRGPQNSATHTNRSLVKSRDEWSNDYSKSLNDSLKPISGASSAAKPSFLSTTAGKVTIAIVAVVGLAAVAGGAAGLSYYLGTQNSKVVNNTIVSNTSVADVSMIDSTILTNDEKSALISLGPTGSFKSFTLLYRGTRDGFFGNVFHAKCDSKSPTVVVIKSDLNSVFGGYTAATWNPTGWKYDSTAFIFSLRRRGFNSTEKFPVQSYSYAIYAPSTTSMPIFGWGYEIYIYDSSDIVKSSYTSCGGYYLCPSGGNTHLAGSYNFYTTEIEVYQVTI